MKRFIALLSLGICMGAAPLLAQTAIEYRERVTLQVGQSVVVYGYRGECGKAPVANQIALPALATGSLSLGKPGTSNSNTCGGATPAVEIVFTATAPGRESFQLRGDKISVRVK